MNFWKREHQKIESVLVNHFPRRMSEANDPTAEVRTKKREPGKISKAIKLGVVGDGNVSHA